MKKLFLYTDLSLLEHGFPVELLVPFIGLYNEEDSPGRIMSGRFDEYMQMGREIIELTTDIEKCDACLLPVVYPLIGGVEAFEKKISSFVEIVENSGKQTFVFVADEISSCRVRIKNSIVFHNSGIKSNQNDNYFSYPNFFEDFIQKYYDGNPMWVDKPAMPSVGFCGYAPPLGLSITDKWIVAAIKLLLNYMGLLKFFPSKTSHSYRARAILSFKFSKKKVLSDFLVKKQFAFGSKGQLNSDCGAVESDSTFRRRYVDNMTNNAYTLCVRGIGNYSIRFFETICCGRIPIFVNTDSILPFDFLIDWKQYCVWVEEKDIDKLPQKVAEFHAQITPEEFLELQKKLRSIWETYMTPMGFFSHLYLFLEQTNKPQ